MVKYYVPLAHINKDKSFKYKSAQYCVIETTHSNANLILSIALSNINSANVQCKLIANFIYKTFITLLIWARNILPVSYCSFRNIQKKFCHSNRQLNSIPRLPDYYWNKFAICSPSVFHSFLERSMSRFTHGSAT